MNKWTKRFLIALNSAMLLLAIYWYYDSKEIEPLIVCIGQVAALISLSLDGKVSKIVSENITNNSDVNLEVNSGDRVRTSGIDNSKINVKTK